MTLFITIRIGDNGKFRIIEQPNTKKTIKCLKVRLSNQSHKDRTNLSANKKKSENHKVRVWGREENSLNNSKAEFKMVVFNLDGNG